MFAPTQTAVIIPVGSAEAAVARYRNRLDVAASWGVPAHVTVLYPFLPPEELGEQVIRRLAAVFAAANTFDCTFARCRWFGEEVLWLAPAPDGPFRNLTRDVVKEFPAYLPYGGEFDDVVPHLTVGESSRGTPDELRQVEAELGRALAIPARIEHALLIAGTDAPSSWHTLATLPLGCSPC